MITIPTLTGKTDRDVEKAIQALVGAVNAMQNTPTPTAAVDLTTLVPLVRAQLQASGDYPLNLTALALTPSSTPSTTPSGGSSSSTPVLMGYHAARPVPSSVPIGTLYWETDRTVLYLATSSSTWTYAMGCMNGTASGRPTGLGINDIGFRYRTTDTSLEYVWAHVSLDGYQYTADSQGWTLVTPGQISIPQPLWFGSYYQISSHYGNDFLAPANFTYIEDDASVSAWGRPMLICNPTFALVPAAQVIGGYAAGGNGATLAASAAATRIKLDAAGLTTKPVVGNYDWGVDGSTTAAAGVDVHLLECYSTSPSESAASCQARVQAAMANIGASRYGLVLMAYTSNLNSRVSTLEHENYFWLPAWIAQQDSRVEMIIAFADLRPTGLGSHPEWMPFLRTIFNGLHGGVPAIP